MVSAGVLKHIAFLVKITADDILKYFSYFSQETRFDISCKLSPVETICMKCQILYSCMQCQILFSGKKVRKISSICHLPNLPSVVNVNPSPANPGYVLPLQTV